MIEPFLELFLDIRTYPLQLLGCALIWAVLALSTRFNRTSVFVLSFSVFFAAGWLVAGVALAAATLEPPLWALVVWAGPVVLMLLFGGCAVFSIAGLKTDALIDRDTSRPLWLIGAVLTAHVFHLLALMLIWSFAAP